MYILCMIEDYEQFFEAIKSVISGLLGAKVESKRREDGVDFIDCSILYMYIECKARNEELDLSYTEDDYNIKTNTQIYINIFTHFFSQGILLIKQLVDKLNNQLYKSIIVEDHSSKAVYIRSGELNCLDESFWNAVDL